MVEGLPAGVDLRAYAPDGLLLYVGQNDGGRMDIPNGETHGRDCALRY